MDTSTYINIHNLSRACNECQLQDLCLPLGLSRGDIERLDQIVNRRKPLQRGASLFRQGDRFQALYAVRSGSIKSYATTNSGEEQINAFHLPGEILGLDAIGSGIHPESSVAMETTSICELPFDRLHTLAHEVDGLQRQLLRIMSRELNSDEQFMRLLANRSAEERLASFLLNLASRFELRGYSGQAFNLSMSRSDIGNYLGLAVETVSRLFTRFQQEGLIEVDRKAITLVDRSRMSGLCNLSATASAGEPRHG
ncbi:transcriptional regulator FNR [Acidihalobacter yilgarnensis]|uniref:Transcriptional regulator FNR n=1 Tax=Acidihalobacter yilgarnensis TaxID=2819280 RepID=A0A1D8IJV5_9GAMM|nr:fumarate/nitrate reduction transcriptional regulator Fnr [Acidihalobacter yilgarnensis]AOU96735.1 transcriptional regulator FNR [Acidihalobacter yilgarnensis]